MSQKGLLVTKEIVDIGTQGAKFYEAKAYQYFDDLNLLSEPNLSKTRGRSNFQREKYILNALRIYIIS